MITGAILLSMLAYGTVFTFNNGKKIDQLQKDNATMREAIQKHDVRVEQKDEVNGKGQ